MTSIREFLHRIVRREWAPAVQVRIPDHQVTDSAAPAGQPPGPALRPAKAYFQVRVNSMALADERVGGTVFEPMLVAQTDYLYGGQVVSLPFVISSKMIAGAADGLPRRMTFANTTVAGPQPYYGRLAVTVMLYRVERVDYVHRLLEAAQRMCAAFDVTGTVSMYLKMADAVLDGVDTVLGHAKNDPVLGFRAEFPDDIAGGTFAVLPQTIPAGELWVADGVLSRGPAGQAAPLAGTSHVTYSVRPAPAPDLQTMPWFRLLWPLIVQWANIPNDEAKQVAQTYLGALYEELKTSPDLARDTADAVYQEYEDQAKIIHNAARKRVGWGPAELRQDELRRRVLEIREPW